MCLKNLSKRKQPNDTIPIIQFFYALWGWYKPNNLSLLYSNQYKKSDKHCSSVPVSHTSDGSTVRRLRIHNLSNHIICFSALSILVFATCFTTSNTEPIIPMMPPDSSPSPPGLFEPIIATFLDTV